jgi:hypothetical protein
MKKIVGKIPKVTPDLTIHNAGNQFSTVTLHIYRIHISLICDNSVTTQNV